MVADCGGGTPIISDKLLSYIANSLLKELRMNLKKTLDVERIISKICRRSGTPRELAGLSNTLDIYDKSFERFREFKSLKN